MFVHLKQVHTNVSVDHLVKHELIDNMDKLVQLYYLKSMTITNINHKTEMNKF